MNPRPFLKALFAGALALSMTTILAVAAGTAAAQPTIFDRIERGTAGGRYTQWTKELGQKLNLPVLDLTNLCADRYERMGRQAVNAFYSDHNHTYLAGADFVAESVVSGLKAFPRSPWVALLSEKGNAVAAADAKYVSENSGAAGH